MAALLFLLIKIVYKNIMGELSCIAPRDYSRSHVFGTLFCQLSYLYLIFYMTIFRLKNDSI